MSRKKMKVKKVTAAVNAMEKPITTTGNALAATIHEAVEVGRSYGQLEGFERGKRAPRNIGEARAVAQRGRVSNILTEVFGETLKALSKHGPMHTGHEGYAVIKEELDELWDEIKADRGKQKSARIEAIQVAAMAVRYALDIDPR